MTYDIVIASNLTELITKVQAKVDEGWKPVGGVTEVTIGYVQAVIKE